MTTKMSIQGKTFGRLTVKSLSGSDEHGKSLWNVVCSCGKRLIVLGSSLCNGNTKSCGCLKVEKFTERVTTHAMHNTGAYRSYHRMKSRCTNPNTPQWGYYGIRGVTVCDRWLDSFENFFADMGERPEGTTLGRILDRGNYEPGNAFWQTRAEQSLAMCNNTALLKWEVLSGKETNEEISNGVCC